MNLVHSSITTSNTGTNHVQKCKSDARLTSSIQPPSFKWMSKSKTNDLNPVIISNSLNSTLNCIIDVMERSFDATAAAAPSPSKPMMASTTSAGPLSLINSVTLANIQVLDWVVRIISSSNTCLLEDQLLLASLFFASTSDNAVMTARTSLSFEQNPIVQYCFLFSRLDTLGKGKARAMKDSDGHSMVWYSIVQLFIVIAGSFVCTSHSLLLLFCYFSTDNMYYSPRSKKLSLLLLVSVFAV